MGKVGYSLIVPTMLFVIAIAVSVSLGYIAIGIRFNKGEDGPGLIYETLGINPAMMAAASLIQDFILTGLITMAIPGLLMVAFALVVNMGRFEGWVIVILGMIMAYYLKNKWLDGGQLPINFSH